mgnify:CR=1 FL=1
MNSLCDLKIAKLVLDALDCLYKLGQIEIPDGTEVLHYVKADNMREV